MIGRDILGIEDLSREVSPDRLESALPVLEELRKYLDSHR